MECRRCASCGQVFRPRAQIPQQGYCSLASCQRERRQRWQQSKLEGDADYRANRLEAQRAWAGRHGDYWREYRAMHPDYTDRNRCEQRRRDRARRSARLATTDASTSIHPVPSGTYRLLPEADGNLAKKDAWTVKITLISRDYEPGGEAGTILQREVALDAEIERAEHEAIAAPELLYRLLSQEAASRQERSLAYRGEPRSGLAGPL
jgi:hypothetical protein